MMSSIDKEMRAHESYPALLREAAEVRRLFIDAGLLVPERIETFLSDTDSKNGQPQIPPKSTVTIPPMPSPERPENAGADWLWIPCSKTTAVTMVLAVLEGCSDGPMRPKDIVDAIFQHNPGLTSGGIYNVGPRLDKAGVIERGDGWKLKNARGFPMIHKGNAWGPPDAFQKGEMACHRRQIILHILRGCAGGLQIMQIVNYLSSFKDCRAPVNKDLVKGDMQAMLESGEVKRVGSSKKYVATAA